MTLRITVPGADYTASNLGRALKLTSDRVSLMGEYILGNSQTASVYNGANTTLPLTVTGTPVYNAGYCTLAQANWFDTRIADNQDVTLLVIGDAASTGGVYCGNFNGANSPDSVVLYKNGTSFVAQASANDGTTQAANSLVSITGADAGFRGLALRASGSANFTIAMDQFEGGVRAGGTLTNTVKTREVQTTPNFAIGSSRGGALFPGPVNIAAVLVWHRALTDPQLLSAYQEMRATMASRGIAC
jgi:hypothetical protein